MRAKKIVVVFAKDPKRASELCFLLSVRCPYRVSVVGSCDTGLASRADCFVVWRSPEAMEMLLHHGKASISVAVDSEPAEVLIEKVRRACARKRGPKKTAETEAEL